MAEENKAAKDGENKPNKSYNKNRRGRRPYRGKRPDKAENAPVKADSAADAAEAKKETPRAEAPVKEASRENKRPEDKNDKAENTSAVPADEKNAPRKKKSRTRHKNKHTRENAPALSESANTDEKSSEEAVSEVKAQPEAPVDKSRYRMVPDYWYEDEEKACEKKEETPIDPASLIEIVGVRFKENGKIYYFAPMGYECPEGLDVIVETARGIEFGTVSIANKMERPDALVASLRPVVRIATPADKARHDENVRREAEAFAVCEEKIAEHGLDMKLIDAEYTFDNSKLTFYFCADGRVDFRELVKSLASVFRTRIELRQIGIRDEAKMLGGLGICGRPFCCSTFLYDFNQVSIRMAKEQNLSLNSSKISGTCGRLMCCLRYECEAYEEEMKRTPKLDSIVKTPDGTGFVIETFPLTGQIKVKLGDREDSPIAQFSRDDVTVIGRRRSQNGEKHERDDGDIIPDAD